MSVSPGSSVMLLAASGQGLPVVSAVLAGMALLGYAAAAVLPSPLSRLAGPALVAGLVAHLVLLVLDIGHLGVGSGAARLGFGPVLSLTVCAVIAVHAVESRLLPVPRVRRALALAGCAAVLLTLAFPGELRVLGSRWAPLHWLLGVAAYGLFGAAVLHALLLDESERRLRRTGRALPAGGHAPLHPVFFLCDALLQAPGVLGLRGGDALCPGLEMGEAAVQPAHLASLQPEAPVGDALEEGAVVADQQDRGPAGGDLRLQGGDGRDVEVVGGFVEQQDVGVPCEGGGQGGAADLAAG